MERSSGNKVEGKVLLAKSGRIRIEAKLWKGFESVLVGLD